MAMPVTPGGVWSLSPPQGRRMIKLTHAARSPFIGSIATQPGAPPGGRCRDDMDRDELESHGDVSDCKETAQH